MSSYGFEARRDVGLGVVVVFGERLKESHQVGNVRIGERHSLKFRRRIAQQALMRELRILNVEVHHIVQGQLASVMQIGRGIG